MPRPRKTFDKIAWSLLCHNEPIGAGFAPRQHASGEKSRMLGISKRGDRTLRKMRIHGARAVLNKRAPKTDKLSLCLKVLSCRAHPCKVIVALARKLARVAWVVMAAGKAYQAIGRITISTDKLNIT